MADSAPVLPPNPLSDPELEYRSVDPWAIIGLLLGVFAAVTVVAPLLWIFALAAILVSVAALARLNRDPNRIGRSAAMVGLALGMLFAVLPPARYLTARTLLADQARPVADQFFEYLRQDRPEKAFMLRIIPDLRKSQDEDVWTYYRHDAHANQEFQMFVRNPLVRTLLALGERAEVRHYRTVSFSSDSTRAIIGFLYTVTYVDEKGQKKTFLASAVLERKPTDNPALCPWRVNDFAGGIDPTAAL